MTTTSRIGKASLNHPIDQPAVHRPACTAADSARKGIHFPEYQPQQSVPREPVPLAGDLHTPERLHPQQFDSRSYPSGSRKAEAPASTWAAAYIGAPSGRLQPDTITPGTAFDDKGRRFLQIDGNSYAARYDSGHHTWRVVQPADPTKPGIAVKRDEDGTWHPDAEVGLRGGDPKNPSAEEARVRLQLHADLAHGQNLLQQLQQMEQTQRQRIQELEGYDRDLEQQIQSVERSVAPHQQQASELIRLYRDHHEVRTTLSQSRQQLQQVLQTQQLTQLQLQQIQTQLDQLQQQ